ncbi:MAG: T9SS type A sorting domain-containing protein, partial [Bacteroidota bacterium]
VSGNNLTTIAASLTSLIPNTTYHFRTKATDGIHTYYGSDLEFITCNSTTPIITGDDSLCPNSGYYTYHCQPGFQNYQWVISPGGLINYGTGTNEVQVTWQQSGNQWIRVSYLDSTGCSSANPTNYPVFVNYLPNAAGPITGLQSVCIGTAGLSYHVDPVPGACAYAWTIPPGVLITQGQWSNDIVVNFSNAAQSGSFTVSGNNLCGNGPDSPAFQVSVNPPPPAPVITLSGDTLFSDAPFGNQWFYQQQSIPGATNDWYVPGMNGDYLVKVTLNGCSSESSNVIHFINTGHGIIKGNQDIAVFPNPSNGRFHIIGQNLSDAKVTVYNLTGANVYDKIFRMNPIDLGELSSGIYFMTISTAKGSRYFKIQIME